MLVSEICEYLGSGLKVPTEINGFLRKSNSMLILCSAYAIMLVSEMFEYLGSGLKLPTEITDFNSLSMPLCTRNEKSKI